MLSAARGHSTSDAPRLRAAPLRRSSFAQTSQERPTFSAGCLVSSTASTTAIVTAIKEGNSHRHSGGVGARRTPAARAGLGPCGARLLNTRSCRRLRLSAPDVRQGSVGCLVALQPLLHPHSSCHGFSPASFLCQAEIKVRIGCMRLDKLPLP